MKPCYTQGDLICHFKYHCHISEAIFENIDIQINIEVADRCERYSIDFTNTRKLIHLKYLEKYIPFHRFFLKLYKTRTTRTPAFWDTPRRPMMTHISSQVKRRQSQSYKFKIIAKNSNFKILQETLHTTHLLKLLDKMCKYEMDPTRTVGATERTQDAGQTDGRTDARTDRVKTIYPPTTSLCGGYNNNQSTNEVLQFTNIELSNMASCLPILAVTL